MRRTLVRIQSRSRRAHSNSALRTVNAHEDDEHAGTGNERQRENEPDEDEHDAEYDAARADGVTQHPGDPIVAARAKEGQRLNGGGALSRRCVTGMVALP
jgi:hypothetical protein